MVSVISSVPPARRRLIRDVRPIIKSTADTMKRLIALLFAFTSSFNVIAADTPFICSISAEKATITQGELPRVKVSITNKSGKDVHLVGSLDGSDVGWRFPKCGFELLDTAGKPVPQKQPMGRCGNMNKLKTTDFVKVAAGAEFNPFGQGFFGSWQLYRFKQLPPGTYIFRFYYQTSTKGVQDYFGDERMMGQKTVAPEIQKLFEAVSLIDIKSNDLQITVQPE